MAVIRFDANVPVELALKYDGGKQVQSRIPEAPDQMMYTVCGDDTIYLPLSVAAQITTLGIRKMELISIMKRVQGGVTKWLVQRAGDTTTAALAKPEQPAMLENQLTRSIEQAKVQRALTTPAAPQNTTVSRSTQQTQPNSTPAPIAHTVISRIMASALIAAFDATQECERYAHTKGVELEFGTEDVRAISNTIFIQLSKDPTFGAFPQKVNGGAQPWQQQ
jgi:hypothetical protein